VIVGSGITVKLTALVAIPPGVVTTIFPVVAPAGTVAVMVVSLTTVKGAAMPLNSTTEVLVRFVPLSVMLAPIPAPALVGVNVLIVGGMMTVKFVALVAVPLGVVTVIGPLVVPDCTLALMVVAFTRVKVEAAVPLNCTADTLVKLVPVMVTTVKYTPLDGVNTVMVGGSGVILLRAQRNPKMILPAGKPLERQAPRKMPS